MTDAHVVSFASNLNLLLQDFYDGYYFECSQPTYCCNTDVDVQQYNECRFRRRFALKQNSIRNVAIYDDFFKVTALGRHPYAVVKYDECFHVGTEFFYSKPRCSHRHCSSMTSFTFEHHYVTKPFMCFNYTRYDGFMYNFYQITPGYKEHNYSFSIANSAGSKPSYFFNDFVSIVPSEGSVAQYMVCDDNRQCFMMSSYCFSFLYWNDVKPSFFQLDGMDAYYNLTYLNYDPSCDERHNFSYHEWPKYITQYVQIMFTFSSSEDYFARRQYLPYALFRSEVPSNYRYLLSEDLMSDCNFTGYRCCPRFCGWTYSAWPNRTKLELHLPSVFDRFKLSTWVTDFFDQLYLELEHIISFALRITAETLTFLFKNFFRNLFETLQKYEFFALFDFCFLFIVFYFISFDLTFSLSLSLLLLLSRFLLFED